MNGKALLVVSFGTTVAGAEESIRAVEEQMKSCSSDRDFFRAFSSGFIRKKLQKSGMIVKSPDEILEELLDHGYDDIIIQPTYIIPGIEYDLLVDSVKRFAGRGATIRMGEPLISNSGDLLEVAEALKSEFADTLELADTALLFMGHGTDHLANFIFPALQTAFGVCGADKAYVATVEGWPELSDAVEQMKKAGLKRVCLIPFLLVAGDHAVNDMAGEQDDSWKNVLQREGFSVECRLSGLGAYEGIRRLYSKSVERADEITF